MELVNGRPEDTAGRLEKEIRTYDFLDSLGVAYQRIDHEAAMTMEACEEIDKMLDATICKNLFRKRYLYGRISGYHAGLHERAGTYE